MRGPVPAKSPRAPVVFARDQRRGTIPPFPAPSLLICEGEMESAECRERSSEGSALLRAECRRVGRGGTRRYPARDVSNRANLERKKQGHTATIPQPRVMPVSWSVESFARVSGEILVATASWQSSKMVNCPTASAEARQRRAGKGGRRRTGDLLALRSERRVSDPFNGGDEKRLTIMGMKPAYISLNPPSFAMRKNAGASPEA